MLFTFRSPSFRIGLLSLLGVCLFTIVQPGFCQQFGKNKVEYRHFNWQSYQIPNFDIYFSQNQGPLPTIASQWIENAYFSLSRDFQLSPKDRLPLILFDSPASFGQTNVINEILPEGVGGFTTQIRNRIVVPFDGSYDVLRHVLHHELVHGFEYAILYDQLGSSLLSGGQAQMPLWFAEGLAEYLSSGWNTEADMFLMDQTIFGSIPLPGPELDGYMAYKGGQSFLYYVASSRGEKQFSRLLSKFKETKNIEASFKSVYDKTPEELGDDWKTELRKLYWPEIGRRTEPTKNSAAITSHVKDHSNFNLKPRISPNGKHIAYYSDLHDYTKILIVDREKNIEFELDETGFGGSFESFHPFRSGMCWSPHSDNLAFVSSEKGKDVISIFNLRSKKRVRTISPNVTAIFAPDWSLRRDEIVFCAINNGESDLFLYDLKTDACTQLTSDIKSKSDPHFSKDGTAIYFACQDTCGLASRTSRNKFSTMSQLWKYDIASRHASQLTFTPWNKKSPSIGNDGKNLMYVSDQNGIDNLYYAPVENPDSSHALTDVIGGCSNPDWAADTALVVYCLFQKSGWDIWQMRDPLKKAYAKPLEKTKWMESLTDTSAIYFSAYVKSEYEIAETKPEKTGKSEIYGNTSVKKPSESSMISEDIFETDTLSALPDSATGRKPIAQAAPHVKDSSRVDSAVIAKPKADSTKQKNIVATSPVKINLDSLTKKPYKLKFAPDMVALGVGTNAYYGYGIAGQWLAVFSDLFGNHQIAVMGDIQGNVADYMHLYASYTNLEHKLNYGGGLFYNREYTSQSIFGDTISFDQNGGGTFLLRYPFSMTSRVDFSAYYENLYRTPYVYNASTGYVTDTTMGPYTVNIFIPTLSYVFDNTLWGITGPLNGIRGQVRAQVSPPIKDIEAAFASLDFDFRKYFHLWHRFVWANKVAFGASIPLRGNEASSKKFFLGGNENWVFYGLDDINSEGYKENIRNFFYSDMIVPFRGWEYLDRIGTKFAVFNTEFRFPFIKEFSLAWPLPIAIRYINGAVFADAGNAWNRDEEFSNFPLPKKIYGGFGFGLRANLGIFVLRYDHAWKTDWTSYAGPTKDYFSLGAEF